MRELMRRGWGKEGSTLIKKAMQSFYQTRMLTLRFVHSLGARSQSLLDQFGVQRNVSRQFRNVDA